MIQTHLLPPWALWQSCISHGGFSSNFLKQKPSQITLKTASHRWDCQNSVQYSRFYPSDGLSESSNCCHFGWAPDEKTGLHLQDRFYEKHLLLNWSTTPCGKRRGPWEPRFTRGGAESHLPSHSEAVLPIPTLYSLAILNLNEFSSSFTLATFQGLNSHLCLVVTVLEGQMQKTFILAEHHV